MDLCAARKGGTANIKLMLDWLNKMTIKSYQRQEESQGEPSALSVVYQAMDDCEKRKHSPLSQMSDGYKGTISLIADIAYRMAILNPQLSKYAGSLFG